MKEQLEIVVLVNIEYNEGHRETAIEKTLDGALTWDIIGSSSNGAKYIIEPVKSKLNTVAPISENSINDCKYYDLAQGRHRCALQGFKIKSCHGVCKDFKQK